MTLGVLYVLSLSRLSSELHQPPEGREWDLVKSRCTECTGWRMRPGLSFRGSVPGGAAVVHAGEGAAGEGVVGGRHGHGHHHALRVDGAPRGAAVVAVQRAALRGAEE
ncbi:hypothetical protein NHX12_000346, partial [Muraenolepis orangiensis]